MPYESKLDHRDGTPVKSQWTVSLQAEQLSFDHATLKEWTSGVTVRWGLHLSPRPENLGVSATALGTPTRDLFIAKFVDGNSNDLWHGYPADPYRHQQDIPPINV